MEFLQYLMITLTGFLAYCIYVVGSFVVKTRRIGKAVNQFPGNPRHWFWGHLHEMPHTSGQIINYFESLVKKYPRACNFWVGGCLKCSIIVHHPDTVRPILKTAEPKALQLGLYKFVVPWLGNSFAFTYSGTKWLRSKKLLTPIFHFGILKEHIKKSNNATDIFMEKLSTHSETCKSVDVSENLCQLALDIILRHTLSYKGGVQIKKDDQLHVFDTITEMLKMIFKRIFRPWLFFDFIYSLTNDGKTFNKHVKYMHGMSEKMIQERKEKMQNSDYNPPQKDFLDILLLAKDEDGIGLSDIDIRDETNTFVLAGMETTSWTISWTLLLLAENPEFQKRCQKEIDNLLDGRDDETDVQWEDLQKMPYLTMCIKEAMRLYTMVPMIERELENPLEIDGITLPVGTIITVSLHNLHRNPTVWKDPEVFDPERFAPENILKIEPFAFLPFSFGPRNCIGQNFGMDQIRLILCKVLRRFNVSPDPKRKVERDLSLVLTSKNGVHLFISERFSLS